MRTRRAFRPALESMPTLALPGTFINPVAPVTVPSTPPPTYINPVAPVTVPVPPTSPENPYTGPDVSVPVGSTPDLTV
ncbi:hypothetical protein [Paludisphaera borealis]|uniref:Uncharacterized protein n=1 Tax=Paludisphaera borealis TaxID=1387353 RepID=A0A1U7CPV0_9BACT|nr:hypothetical protein [Paludisphaera borealis]APW60903.1 hypothetical protein BSF38_02395 [Paludisphaera borealis]